VAIRSSSSQVIERLVGNLCTGDAPTREAAGARLRVIGRRAVERLASVIASDTAPAARAAALSVLEAIDEPRTLEIARATVADADPVVAAAAVGVLRGWLTRERGTDVLDLLCGIALDGMRDARVRLAALDALSELPRRVVQPVLQQASAGLRAGPEASSSDGGAADDPLAAREWIATHPKAPLSTLHDLVLHVREQERREPAARARQSWLIARGAVHAALARRGSRVALYDLRESFDAAQEPLSLDFLAAMSALGDDTCLAPLARAWAAAPGETWWRDRLRDAAREIMKREKLTGRHAAVKRVRAKWPGFVSPPLDGLDS
jgi:hypothetical protein